MTADVKKGGNSSCGQEGKEEGKGAGNLSKKEVLPDHLQKPTMGGKKPFHLGQRERGKELPWRKQVTIGSIPLSVWFKKDLVSTFDRPKR